VIYNDRTSDLSISLLIFVLIIWRFHSEILIKLLHLQVTLYEMCINRRISFFVLLRFMYSSLSSKHRVLSHFCSSSVLGPKENFSVDPDLRGKIET